MEFHEYANLFPMMTGSDYQALKDDIAANGLLEPVVIFEDKVLDGRNRYAACLDLGIEPAFIEWQQNGTKPLDYVISKNLHRRHLNETQRAVVASKIANMAQGNFSKAANLPLSPVSQSEAASMLNVSERTVRSVKEIERKAPELMQKLASGEMTAHEAKKVYAEKERKEQRAYMADAAIAMPEADRWHIYQGDIRTWKAPRQYDFIITDPPYPREFLPLYGVLACRADEWLKPGGMLVAMCGQSYLDHIQIAMSDYLEYYWTAAYLTPGQPTPLRQVNVNTTWKPLLIYTRKGERYSGKIFGDVFKSDGNDKDFHVWGQSISGMMSVVSQICLPGQSILDPFCGAGATGIAAVKHGCLFDGLELLEENVNISKGRIHDASKT